ncbi:MAG: 2-phosphotransferase [Bacteroidota bacterium]|nr:2-phosphotransferase [Bacteroidota bacterium]
MSDKHKNTSKFISLVLRHKPEEIGLILDENGWADTQELIDKMNATGPKINLATLKEIVATNDKKRFAFNDDYSKIRANQGHSIEVDLQLKPQTPPDILYHGTADRFLDAIMQNGLNKMSRQHVHLSASLSTATNVGQRHGRPIVLIVDAKQMEADGVNFYLSDNEVWLTEHVAVKYLTKKQ